jgi:hypothetical protein
LDPIDVAMGGDIDVSWYYTMAKHEEDTEIFQTMIPTKHLIVTIIDTNPTKRIVRAESIHRSDLRQDISASAQGTYNFYLVDSRALNAYLLDSVKLRRRLT